jgi:phosphoglycolate phosphatase
MKYQAIIFDLDGTLLDSVAGIADSANFLLKKRGFPEFSQEDYNKFVGDGLEKLVYRILPPSERNNINGYVNEYRSIYKKKWPEKTRVYHGIRELLDYLSVNGIKRAVLSNKSDEYVRIMVKKLLPDHPFDVVWGERPGIPRKPDPFAARQISQQFSLNSESVLFVGDSDIDMETGKNAGMVPVGVNWGLREKQELLDSGAIRVIDHPLDLLDFFETRSDV